MKLKEATSWGKALRAAKTTTQLTHPKMQFQHCTEKYCINVRMTLSPDCLATFV